MYLKVDPVKVVQAHLKQTHTLNPGTEEISILPGHVAYEVIFFFRETGL